MAAPNFEKIYKQHKRALASFALKLTHNKMDADDLVQETAIKAFSNYEKFNQGSSFKNWSFTILKNTFITKYNKRKNENFISAPIEDIDFALAFISEYDAHEDYNTTIKHLKECINDLSIKTKLPFTMYINGYRYKEIADHLEIPIGTVKSRINFARKKLKQKHLCR